VLIQQFKCFDAAAAAAFVVVVVVVVFFCTLFNASV
jgi:hypothetical protein